MPSSARRPDLVRAVLWMTGALLSFSAMAISVRALSGALKVMEILALRNAGALLILLVLGAFNPALMRAVSVKRIRLHAARNVIHFAAQYLWALGVTLLPLATVFALEFTAPAHAVVLSAVFLRERLTPGRIGVVALGFLGVLVILRPGLESFQPAAFLVLGAAVGFAIQLTITKAMTATETPYAIMLWMNLIQLPLALLGSDPRAYLGLGAAGLLLPACALAATGLASHFCVAQAFRHGDASLVVPMDFMRVPLIAVAGWQLYGERIDGWVFLGAGVIVSGVLWNLRAEASRKPEAQNKATA
jgi:drug/metabolite transporter (DMT)-like permease